MRTTTPSGVEVSATLIGSYRPAEDLYKIGVMCAFEPGSEITSEDDEKLFDWLLMPNGTPAFSPALNDKRQIVSVESERWNDPASGRPRKTYSITYNPER